MRIEVDKQLAKVLAEIKAKEPTIYGRGHVETIRFLAHYYLVHKPLQGLVDTATDAIIQWSDTMEDKMEVALERVFPRAAAKAVANILLISGYDLGLRVPQKTETDQSTTRSAVPGSHTEDAQETPRAELPERSTPRRRRLATTQRQQDEEAITARRAEKEGEE